MKMKILSIVLLLNVSFMKTIIIAAPIELQNKTELPLFFILSGNEKDLSTLNTNVIVPGKKIISNKAINTPTYLLILHKPEGMGFKYTFPVGKTIDVYIGGNDLRLKSNASFMSTSKVKEKDIKATQFM